MAIELHLNLRTLQRKLLNEGYGFRALLNQTWEGVAQEYIRNPHLSFTEIAYLLGFSDQVSFTRALKRWTNTSPREFRKKMYSEDGACY
ncbi:helix-turn-helix transcriptional regulator [Teredinibacter franksiae]|uniref:helix-turn-helix transcriptional regulator n=1 Tax=Teredinibacter franksiae TaxID=2761453 RepID=UPI0035E45254